MRLRNADCGLLPMRCLPPLMLAALILASPPAAMTAPSRTTDTQPATTESWQSFGRSGKTVTVRVWPLKAVAADSVVLRAFGRVWTAPAAIRTVDGRGVAELTLPMVRVATVFGITPPDDPHHMGRIVVYPDRDVEWDKEIRIYSLGAPAWFDQWASATGLPVIRVCPGDVPTPKPSNTEDGSKALLILGPSTAGASLVDVSLLSKGKDYNVVVMDADWFRKFAVSATMPGGQIHGKLLSIAYKELWPSKMGFSSRRQPCGDIINRWPWISDREDLPLVEKVAWVNSPSATPRCVILNYLPWDEQLGQREEADELLRATLIAAAEASVSGMEWRGLNIVYPARDKITPKDRPVLAAAVSAPDAFKGRPQSVHVVDLRGTDRLPDEILNVLKALEGQVGPDTDADKLLLLGDDKLLDEWSWLKLDRAKKTTHRRGAVWLSDDKLPPSIDNQIRLMQTLTDLGVPLGVPVTKENGK